MDPVPGRQKQRSGAVQGPRERGCAAAAGTAIGNDDLAIYVCQTIASAPSGRKDDTATKTGPRLRYHILTRLGIGAHRLTQAPQASNLATTIRGTRTWRTYASWQVISASPRDLSPCPTVPSY